MNFSKCLAFCFLFAFSFAAISVDVKADNSKLREKAKAELSEGIAEEDDDKTLKALIALIQMSDSGDDEASYILGILFTKSKVPKIKRSVTTAEKYLLRGAKNCHRGSLKAIGDYVYKKRGSKLFDPTKAKRLETACEQRNQIVQTSPSPEPTTPKTTRKNPPPRSNEDNNSVITASVRSAWASQRPRSQLFGGGASGVAISTDGVFLTNHHVVDGCLNVAVKYQDMLGRARVLFADADLDLAAIKVDAPTPFYATFDSSSLRLGEPLVALGYPVGDLFGNDPTVSEGRLTNTEQGDTEIKARGYLLVSIPLASGNSGGPVFNNRGLLRGLVSYGISNEKLAKIMEERGRSVRIHSVTFNFIVSGLSVIERLNQKNVRYRSRAGSRERLDVEEIAALGKMSLANVVCG